MDDYLFKANVDRCKHVVETTTYLEIFSYSVGYTFMTVGGRDADGCNE